MADNAPDRTKSDGPADGAPGGPADRSPDRPIAELMGAQAEAAWQLLTPMAAVAGATVGTAPPTDLVEPEAAIHWAGVAQQLQLMWARFSADQIGKAGEPVTKPRDFGKVFAIAENWWQHMPFADPKHQLRLMDEGLAVWEAVLGQFGVGRQAEAAGEAPRFPRDDPRFTDSGWREQPFFALLHQGYLMVAEQMIEMAEAAEGLDPDKKAQLRFTTRAIADALSPANFPLTNPVALARARETRGQSLIKGMEHLLDDLRRGQLTHTPSDAFKVGETIANTPGKVVHETPLYQLIQYSPVTEQVLAVPLVIFPPWINRFYILDLNPQKSFVRWAVGQGLSVFIVSWKSADETMGEIVWDDYVAAQVAAIDFVRERLGVPAVHAVGYCVAGTTLAATLAVLGRKNEADRVASATFFTAQVDFEHAGDLKHLIDEQSVEAIAQAGECGYVDGRYLAAAFNMLRGNDLIWNYVRKHYLLGEDYPAFDLLYWNGDVANLPARWHQEYLRDLYRDNRLVVPDSLSVGEVPIDLRRISTPCYIQAGREDHIAPADSVWKLTRFLDVPWTFVLAGSGHIAGVVNPPSSGKYQFWTNERVTETLADFIRGASEHPGSWWPHWLDWLRARDPREVPADGRRRPGMAGDEAIENAPGRYVTTR